MRRLAVSRCRVRSTALVPTNVLERRSTTSWPPGASSVAVTLGRTRYADPGVGRPRNPEPLSADGGQHTWSPMPEVVTTFSETQALYREQTRLRRPRGR